MRKICLLTQGCNCHVEQFRILLQNLKSEYELTQIPTEADLIIQHFCISTSAALPNIITEMAYLKKIKKDGAVLIICGCAVNTLGKELFEQFEYVDYVVGRENVCEEVLKILNKTKFTDMLYIEQNQHKLTIEIVDGCINKCTFCKVHYMDLPLKSKSIEEIVQRVKSVVDSGIGYIRLSGLNTTLYGVDLYGKPVLHELLQKLSKLSGLLNIDITGLATMNMYEDLISEIERNSKIGRIDMIFQSGSPHMLKVMDIHTSIERMEELIRRVGYKIRYTTFVIGHPHETDEDLDLTIDFVKRNNLWYTERSPYQDAPGLLSHDMPQLSEETYNAHVEKFWKFVYCLKKEEISKLIGKRVNAFIEYAMCYTSIIHVHLRMENSPWNILVRMEPTEENINFLNEVDDFSKCKVTITQKLDSNMWLEGTGLETA